MSEQQLQLFFFFTTVMLSLQDEDEKWRINEEKLFSITAGITEYGLTVKL